MDPMWWWLVVSSGASFAVGHWFGYWYGRWVEVSKFLDKYKEGK